MVLPPFWQVTPLGVLAVLLALGNEVGRRRLAHRQSDEHRQEMLKRSLLLYAGLLVLFLFAVGPVERWSMEWLAAHMAMHVVEMFFLPPLLIAGAPFVPLLFALPVRARRRVLSTYYRAHSLSWLRWLVACIRHPISAIVLFNVVMVTWHVPAVFNWAMANDWAMSWLMAPSFVFSGILFWRVILFSPPFGPRGSTLLQAGGVIVTAFEMLVLAMSLSIFSHAAWYSGYVMSEGAAVAFHDQKWAAAILWICSDLWAVPALVLIGYRTVYKQSDRLSSVLERALGRA